MTLASLIMLSTVAWAGCEEDLEEGLTRAERAFTLQDRQAVADADAEVDQALSCLQTPLSPSLAARVHRVDAMRAHLTGSNSVELHLRAMRRADPWLQWDVAEPTHPLTLQLYAAEEARVPPLQWLPGGERRWIVDGLAVPVLPTDAPVVLQEAGADGRVTRTLVETAPRIASERRSGGGSAPRGLGWKVAGAATAALAGGLYGGAWAANGAYHRTVGTGDDDRLVQLHGTTNALAVGSVAASGVAVGLLTVGFTR